VVTTPTRCASWWAARSIAPQDSPQRAHLPQPEPLVRRPGGTKGRCSLGRRDGRRGTGPRAQRPGILHAVGVQLRGLHRGQRRLIKEDTYTSIHIQESPPRSGRPAGREEITRDIPTSPRRSCAPGTRRHHPRRHQVKPGDILVGRSRPRARASSPARRSCCRHLRRAGRTSRTTAWRSPAARATSSTSSASGAIGGRRGDREARKEVKRLETESMQAAGLIQEKHQELASSSAASWSRRARRSMSRRPMPICPLRWRSTRPSPQQARRPPGHAAQGQAAGRRDRSPAALARDREGQGGRQAQARRRAACRRA